MRVSLGDRLELGEVEALRGLRLEAGVSLRWRLPELANASSDRLTMELPLAWRRQPLRQKFAPLGEATSNLTATEQPIPHQCISR